MGREGHEVGLDRGAVHPLRDGEALNVREDVGLHVRDGQRGWGAVVDLEQARGAGGSDDVDAW